VRILIQLIFMIGHVLVVDRAFSENTEFRNTTDDMVVIPSGKFRMGCNQFGPMHGAPEHWVYLSEFMIDRFEVTNKRFEEIIPDHKRRRSKLSKCDKCPVTNVSWYEAVDYCYLTGKTLPTEAQWEKAAGNGDGCGFPWGYDFDPIHSQGRGGLEMRDKSVPVGTYPANKYGIYDMGGNVWEWVSDWMAPGYQVSEVLINPQGPSSGIMKVRRGGAYSDSIKAMATGYRDWSHPSSRFFSDVGFRCAINIKGKSLDGLTTQD
jgi:formylglycine-generating enzyme required for sulfatase activity